MDTFTIILDNLTKHGVPDALERANEIEAEMNQPEVKVDKDFYFNSAFLACSMYYPAATQHSVKSKSRKKQLVMVRQIITWLLRNNSDLTLDDIGEMLGNRHHSTQIWALKSIDNTLSYDRQFDKMLRDINNKFKSIVNK